MMKKLIVAVLLIGTVILLSSCKDDNPSDPGPGNGQGYFPNSDGSYYKYSISKTDSNNTIEPGSRTSTFSGTQVVASQNYQVQIDTFIIGSETNVSNSYFRKTNTGLFYFLDTTRLSASIPDSLQQFVTVDTEIQAILFILNEGSNWSVFRLRVSILTPIEVSASFAGTENVTLNLNTGTESRNAVKIRYQLRIALDQDTRIYEAYCWLVDGIGIVKIEGNAAIVNGISGGGIDLSDTTGVITQNLIEYNIQ